MWLAQSVVLADLVRFRPRVAVTTSEGLSRVQVRNSATLFFILVYFMGN